MRRRLAHELGIAKRHCEKRRERRRAGRVHVVNASGLQEPLNDDRLSRNSDSPHGSDGEQEPPHALDGMRPIGRRHVNEFIAVVNPMEPPHGRPHMQKTVGDVAGREVEQHGAYGNLREDRQPESPRLAARRPRVHVRPTNIGTAVSSRDARAITVKMIVVFDRNSRALIVRPPRCDGRGRRYAHT